MVGEYVRQYGANATALILKISLLQTLLTIHWSYMTRRHAINTRQRATIVTTYGRCARCHRDLALLNCHLALDLVVMSRQRPSERIRQIPADTLSVGATRVQALTGQKLDDVLTMRQRPQLPDPSDIDDVRAMNPQETARIQ